jgi:hypothetical protein
MRHPGKYELLSYAESLTEERSTISVRIAGHVAQCPACQAEVEAMRSSLFVLRLIPDIDPSDDSTLRLIKAARDERRRSQHRTAPSGARTVLKGLGYAAGILLVSALCFGAALVSRGPIEAPVAAAPVLNVELSQASPESLSKATADIEALASAVSGPSKNPPSARELERRRAVTALSKDFEAARAALASGVPFERARKVMDANLQRQAQTLRSLYAERSF